MLSDDHLDRIRKAVGKPYTPLSEVRRWVEATVAAGFWMAPLEPTDEMRRAGMDAIMDNIGGDYAGRVEVQTYVTRQVWTAMRKAAPIPDVRVVER